MLIWIAPEIKSILPSILIVVLIVLVLIVVAIRVTRLTIVFQIWVLIWLLLLATITIALVSMVYWRVGVRLVIPLVLIIIVVWILILLLLVLVIIRLLLLLSFIVNCLLLLSGRHRIVLVQSLHPWLQFVSSLDFCILEHFLNFVAFSIHWGKSLELQVCLLVEHVAFGHVVTDDAVQHLMLVPHQLFHQLIQLLILWLEVSECQSSARFQF